MSSNKRENLLGEGIRVGAQVVSSEENAGASEEDVDIVDVQYFPIVLNGLKGG